MSTNDEFFDRAEFVAYFRDETEELLQTIDSDLLRLERYVDGEPPDAAIVNALFRGLHTIKGSAGMLDLRAVADVAHKLESLCDLLRRERMPLSQTGVNLFFEGRDFLTHLVRAAVENAPAPSGVTDFIARLDAHAAVYDSNAQASDGMRPAALEPAAESPTPRAAAVIAAPAATLKNQTIRVDVERLDLLLNLVGELVINRTRISDIAATLARSAGDPNPADGVGLLVKDLAESSALLARTTNEIQESIMKVRMVPIGTVFERFPRMVRDLAKAHGKVVSLQIHGGDTDLDKTIVDEVGEPLMHLVRNCIDHGIEEPPVRAAAGKPRAGLLELNAYHEGNQIIVEVSDDGGGIHLDRVRAKALAAGLLGESDRPTDREIMELIFAPGFSTAAAITGTSGRGVGMEIVKRNITGLGGVFEIESAPGKGTTFRIKLPLTLAIIGALLVRVADELYSIPLDAVIESQRIHGSAVRTVNGAEVITLRGQVVPLIRVAEFFGLRDTRDREKVLVVIVGLAGRQVGLVVDAFHGEAEIVIKPLSDVIGAIPGISGATILGNGSISLILDVHSLVTTARNAQPTPAHLSGAA